MGMDGTERKGVKKMNELVKIVGKEVFTDSMVIAQGTGNQHHAVRELIKRYKTDIEDFGTLLILNEKSTGGRPLELFQLNEEQATFVITLLKNSKKVVVFKKELVRQFYIMRNLLQEHNSLHWQNTRLESKSSRLRETDKIKEFIQYAKKHGSQHADTYYITFSKLANKAVGISSKQREKASINQLNNLILIENIINRVIQIGIEEKVNYKSIYQACKERIEQFREITYLNVQIKENALN